MYENEIISIDFYPNDRNLTIRTKKIINGKSEYMNFVFNSVYAFGFNQLEEYNEIMEIAGTQSLTGFLNWYFSQPENKRIPEISYGFPLPFNDKVSASKKLSEENKYNYFEVNATVGMDGYVLAKKYKTEEIISSLSD